MILSWLRNLRSPAPASRAAPGVEENDATGGLAGQGGSGGAGVGGVYDLGSLSVDPATVVANNHVSTGNDDFFP